MDNSEATANHIIHQLVALGINRFFLAPGYRSTSLVYGVKNHPNTTSTVFFDERGLGFMALGYAKAKGSPCAIVTTSGSALANLYPSVVEAYKNHIPLILLTADRPYEMQDSGQNQTIEQQNFFAPYTCHTLNLPTFDNKVDEEYLSSAISNAVSRAIKHKRPVHINCPLRKPFLANAPTTFSTKKPITFSNPVIPPSLKTIDNLKGLCKNKEGIIILGRLSQNTDLIPIFKLAKKLGWPIFADPQSPASQYQKTEELISHFELILKSNAQFKANCILQFGDRFVSSALLEWIKEQVAEYIHITPYQSFYDPIRKITHKIEADPASIAEELLKCVSPTNIPLLPLLKERDHHIEKMLEEHFSSEDYFSEKNILYRLAKKLEPNMNLFISNSTPIRNSLEIFSPSCPINIYTNRGASGIDGNVSTAIGIHLARPTKTLAIIGDQAALHDLNSFAAAKEKNLHFLIFNNSGGGIFSSLPLSRDKELFERYFQAKHSFTFSNIAEQFSLSYKNIKTFQELNDLSIDTLPTVLEVTTSNEVNLRCQKELFNNLLEKSLC
jgi:2-succinyl-5-enolpyruvyl-6-hydroxy-3-cyclohexene-1-carboxylate synthase